jgi:hypothetical protein
MHLYNVLASLNASECEIEQTVSHFKHAVVSYSAVRDFIGDLRESSLK